ncbi:MULTISPECIES: PaaI family thioesterase [Phyllobacteriaceae]|jgi:uncharacterized protein (TIGR00369 family)|uniref:PaaI family thioesterase n=2 Tax=Phyllobacteriaceae TaxID=69277 RepID=A0ABV3WYF9_9HYPH|nr:PaaI family thioesterase [Mesorhizobium sediminum]MCV0398306.1 PaaI family thioesterase [Rhizobiaceae bacterium]MCV0406690.1 PaaI family thioesterase [Rhizobiaceae bacterium]NRC57110.1 PaaI family thioesterase [Mesorhizobium sediminum]
MTPDLATQQLRKVPFFQFLDFMITELAETHAAATMPFAERLIGNPIMEYYHGGIIASFMEAVAAISVSHGPDLQPPKPINLTVDYLRPAVKGALMAEATVTRKGKRMASVRTACWQDDASRPVAEGLYHFLLV